MSAHTPIPWQLGDGFDCPADCFVSDSTLGIARVIGHPRSPEEARANARLIAAAPDLLAALETCAFELHRHGFLRSGQAKSAEIADALNAARAALARATGDV